MLRVLKLSLIRYGGNMILEGLVDDFLWTFVQHSSADSTLLYVHVSSA